LRWAPGSWIIASKFHFKFKDRIAFANMLGEFIES
jgi:hypothetical protein